MESRIQVIVLCAECHRRQLLWAGLHELDRFDHARNCPTRRPRLRRMATYRPVLGHPTDEWEDEITHLRTTYPFFEYVIGTQGMSRSFTE